MDEWVKGVQKSPIHKRHIQAARRHRVALRNKTLNKSIGMESPNEVVTQHGSRWDQKIKKSRRGKWSWTQCTRRCAMARGHRLNTSIFGRYPRRAFTISSSPPTWSPSLISHLASVNVKQNVLVLEVVSPRQLLKGAPRRRRKFRAQELGESRGGRPEGAVLNKPTVSVDVKQHFNNRSKFAWIWKGKDKLWNKDDCCASALAPFVLPCSAGVLSLTFYVFAAGLERENDVQVFLFAGCLWLL